MGSRAARHRLDPQAIAFAQRVRHAHPHAKVILFGSRARGDHLKSSDYDFIVVSDHFREIPWPRRPVDLYPFWEGPGGIELLCYTGEEFERKRGEIGIVAEAVKEGIEL